MAPPGVTNVPFNSSVDGRRPREEKSGASVTFGGAAHEISPRLFGHARSGWVIAGKECDCYARALNDFLRRMKLSVSLRFVAI